MQERGRAETGGISQEITLCNYIMYRAEEMVVFVNDSFPSPKQDSSCASEQALIVIVISNLPIGGIIILNSLR